MKSTICLNMIVKNASKTIEACIKSVLPYINSVCIVDTGSTDNTIELIKKVVPHNKLHLFERPWINFAHNRNEALVLGRQYGDYLLLMDADFVFNGTFPLLDFKHDAYSFWIKTEDNMLFHRNCLISSKLNWYYEYELHEQLKCDKDYNLAFIDDSNTFFLATQNSERGHDINRRKRDIVTLLKAFSENPDPHYLFYLAQTYRNDEQYLNALKAYQHCLAIDDCKARQYYCQLQIARMREELGHPDELVVNEYIKAHTLNQNRTEAMGYLAQFWEKKRLWWAMAWAANEVGGRPLPQDVDSTFLIELDWYTWRIMDKYAVACLNNGQIEDGLRICEQLIESECTPEIDKKRIAKNMERTNAKFSKVST